MSIVRPSNIFSIYIKVVAVFYEKIYFHFLRYRLIKGKNKRKACKVKIVQNKENKMR